MYSTYHLTSAQDLSTDILDAIKAAFKSKPITIIVEEGDRDFEHTELYNPQFVDMVLQAQQDVQQGKGKKISSKQFDDLWK